MTDPLPRDVVEEIIKILSQTGDAFLVGGQALNFWAERYTASAPELGGYGPFTSKDVDFFGSAQLARKLASALGGKAIEAGWDNHGPGTAVVEANVLGHRVEIDFLGSVKGPPSDKLKQQAVEIDYPLRTGAIATTVPLRVMHPLHCLQSRAANVIGLRRGDRVSKRQLDAASIVLREYISEALGSKVPAPLRAARIAKSVLKGLANYLVSDLVGTRVHHYTLNNPLEVIRAFRNDPRLDVRYRDKQLEGMIQDIVAVQTRIKAAGQ